MNRNILLKSKLGFGLASLLIAGIGFTSYRSITALVESGNRVSHVLKTRGTVEKLTNLLMIAQNYRRDYLITGQKLYRDHYQLAARAVPGAVKALRSLTQDSISQQQRLEELEPLLEKRLQFWQEHLDFAGKTAAMGDPEPETRSREIIPEILAEEEAHLDQSTLASRHTGHEAIIITVLGSAVAFLLVVFGLYLVIEDMALRMRVEHSLKKTTKTLKTLIDSSPLGILVIGLDKRLNLWNPACERIFGWASDEVLSQFFPGLSQQLTEKLFCSGEKIELQNDFQRKNGEFIKINISTIPLHHEGDQLLFGYMAVVRDVTDQVKAEAELLQAKEVAVRAAKSKSEFLANMSHEIRTPLNGVIGMTDLLLETKLDPQQEKFAKIVQDSGKGLLTIINDILDFSKIEAGKMTLEIIEFNSVLLVEGQAELLVAKAKEQGLSLMTYIDPKVPPLVKGDPGRVGQVLLNLIGNSLKFTPSGTIVVRVSPIEVNADNSLLRFSVTDTGIGLSEESKKHLFQPFTQADGSTARKYGGTGLGLSICRHLIDLMGGEIGVESVEGQGSTFWFTIRLATVEAKKESAPVSVPQLQSTRVLVVDDDPVASEIMSRYLSSWNIHALVAEGGKKALALMRRSAALQESFDIVITDKRMPEMDGFTLAQAIQDDPNNGQPKLILTTAFDRVDQSEAAKKAGFSAYLTKPVKQSELYNAIIDAISSTRVDLPEPLSEHIDATPVKSSNEPHPMRILVADDNSVNQLLAVTMLKRLGYAAQAVANGREALDAVKKGLYDLVLMDCQMPEMDGYEATRAIREWESQTGRHIPIVALTANAMSEDEERCLKSGMDDYITKPLKRENLETVVKRWLEREQKSDTVSAA